MVWGPCPWEPQKAGLSCSKCFLGWALSFLVHLPSFLWDSRALTPFRNPSTNVQSCLSVYVIYKSNRYLWLTTKYGLHIPSLFAPPHLKQVIYSSHSIPIHFLVPTTNWWPLNLFLTFFFWLTSWLKSNLRYALIPGPRNPNTTVDFVCGYEVHYKIRWESDEFLASHSKRKRNYTLTTHFRTWVHSTGKYLLDSVPVQTLVILSGFSPKSWMFFLTDASRKISTSTDFLHSRFSAAEIQ